MTARHYMQSSNTDECADDEYVIALRMERGTYRANVWKNMRVGMYALMTVWLSEHRNECWCLVTCVSCLRMLYSPEKTPLTTGSEEKRPLVRLYLRNIIPTPFYGIPGTSIIDGILDVHGGNQAVETNTCFLVVSQFYMVVRNRTDSMIWYMYT